MTDVKRLLATATPLPWDSDATQEDEAVVLVHKETPEGTRYASVLFQADWGTEDDAALIVHAVNTLPDYEAAVDALEALQALRKSGSRATGWAKAWENATDALARLRGAL